MKKREKSMYRYSCLTQDGFLILMNTNRLINIQLCMQMKNEKVRKANETNKQTGGQRKIQTKMKARKKRKE